MKGQRVKVTDIEDALEATGYRLRRGWSLDPGHREGCPLAILALAGGLIPEESVFHSKVAGDALGLSLDYREGFTAGFDMIPGHPEIGRRSGDHDRGIEDGFAVAERFMVPGRLFLDTVA